jgi:hypothetical protein
MMADGMMGNPFLGLLNQGMSPEQAQAEVDRQRALQFANLNPQQRISSGIYGGITQAARALGVRDPMLEQASQLRRLAQQFDTTTAEGMMQYANALRQVNPQAAQQAAMQAQQMMQQQAVLGKTRAEQAKAVAGEQEIRARTAASERKVSQDEELRDQLAALPETATNEDFLRVARRFGNPDTIIRSIETSQTAKAKLDADAELKRERRAFEERMQQRDADLRRELASMRQSGEKTKLPLPTATDRNRLAVARDTVIQTQGTIDQIDKYVQMIEDGDLSFSFFGNLASSGRVAAGVARATDVNKQDFNRFVLGAANALLLQAKGTQTEGDAQRARDQVVDALAKNDNKTVKSALTELRSVIERTRKSAELTIEDFNESFGTSKAIPGTPAPTPRQPAAGGKRTITLPSGAVVTVEG